MHHKNMRGCDPLPSQGGKKTSQESINRVVPKKDGAGAFGENPVWWVEIKKPSFHFPGINKSGVSEERRDLSETISFGGSKSKHLIYPLRVRREREGVAKSRSDSPDLDVVLILERSPFEHRNRRKAGGRHTILLGEVFS